MLGDERRRRERADADRAQRHHLPRNTGNIIQALDGRTGDLIWENHVGPIRRVGFGAMRSIAIYEDKIFIATTDARLVALDARTGKNGLGHDDRRSRERLRQHRAARSSTTARSCRA